MDPGLSREALREHFAAAGQAGAAGFRIEDVRVHQTADPEVIIGEFAYRGDEGWAAPGIIVFRIRDGLIVKSRDYIDHLGLARATNTVDALCAQLTDTVSGNGSRSGDTSQLGVSGVAERGTVRVRHTR